MRLTAVIAGYLPRHGLEVGGVLDLAVLTQGMHGNDHFFSRVPRALDRFCLSECRWCGNRSHSSPMVYGGKAWSRTLLGFVTGSLVASLYFSTGLELMPQISFLTLLIAVASPSVGGLIAFQAEWPAGRW